MSHRFCYCSLAWFAVLVTAEAGSAEPRYAVTDIGTLNGMLCIPAAVNNAGQISGTAHPSPYRGFFWDAGVMTDLGTLGGSRTVVRGMNDLGQVVGQSYNSGSDWRAFRWDSVTGITNLGVPPGFLRTVAFGINDAGSVVGYAYVYSWSEPRAFVYRDGAWTMLGSFGGTYGQANDVNNLDQVVGIARIASGAGHAFLWENGVMTDLNPAAGAAGANCINDLSQIVGTSEGRAALWQGGTMTDLGTLGGTTSEAYGINLHGQVVGLSALADNAATHAFLWENGVLYDLNNLIAADSGWVLSQATGINDDGWIVGAGQQGGQDRGALLRPLPAITDCNNNGVDDAEDIAAGTSRDCNVNATPDECDLASGNSRDCQPNSIPDECDLALGTSSDANDNGIPDECEEICHAQRTLPLCYAPAEPQVVTLSYEPPAGTFAVGLEDSPPEGWTVGAISAGGTWDPVHGKVKWVFFDGVARTVSYAATPPAGQAGAACFAGAINFDGGLNACIDGESCFDDQCAYHPADLPDNACGGCSGCPEASCTCATCSDWRIELCEIVGYICCWQAGCHDEMATVIRGAYLYLNGESYCWDDAAQTWFPAGGCGGGAALASEVTTTLDDLALRGLPGWYIPGEPVTVTITYATPEGTLAAGVEELPPAGWSVSGISDGGTWDATHGRVKWVFFDGAARTLSYTAMPPVEAEGEQSWSGAINFNGGLDRTIGGAGHLNRRTRSRWLQPQPINKPSSGAVGP